MIVDVCKGITDVYPGLRETFKMECFAIILNSFRNFRRLRESWMQIYIRCNIMKDPFGSCTYHLVRSYKVLFLLTPLRFVFIYVLLQTLSRPETLLTYEARSQR